MSRQDEETREHEEMATVDILLDDKSQSCSAGGSIPTRDFSASRSFRRRHTGFLLPLPRHSALCPDPTALEIESKTDGGLGCKR